MRRIVLLVTIAAVVLALAASGATAKPSKEYDAVGFNPDTGDRFTITDATKKGCEAGVATFPPEWNFSECTKLR